MSRGGLQKPVEDVKEEAVNVHKIYTNAICAPAGCSKLWISTTISLFYYL